MCVYGVYVCVYGCIRTYVLVYVRTNTKHLQQILYIVALIILHVFLSWQDLV